MKTRRFLAGLLCAALIFSSEAFTMGAMASELPASAQTDEIIVETDDTLVVDETEEPTAEPTEEPVAEPEATAEATEEPTQEPEVTEGPTAEATEAPTQAPEVTEEPTAEATEEPTEAPEESPEGTEEATEEPTVEATEEPTVEATEEPTAEMTEEPSEEPEETEEPSETPDVLTDIEIVQGSEDFFYVDEDGVLRLVPGAEMKGTTIMVPAEAKVIPSDIFAGKTSIKYVKFEEGSILTDIEAGAFEDSGILEIILPEGVTVVKESTFKNSYLKKITILGEVTTIEKEAFADTPLTAITANDVTSVGNNAFANCSSLKTVKMSKLETIGSKAFQYCSALNAGMSWSANLTSIESGAFKGCGFESINLSAVGTEGLTLGTGVFESCTNLVSVVFSSGMTEIADSTFKGCKNLKNVNLNPTGSVSNITTICENAFNGCAALERIILPASVSQIYAGAFAGCGAITEVNILNPDPNGDGFMIAQSAFPVLSNNNQVTMKGYNGEVQEYAIAKGYKFKTLYTAYAIEYYPSDYGTMTINKNPAIPGDEIQVKITPKEGYCLTSAGLIATCDSAFIEPKFVKDEEGVQTFTFEMPVGKVTLKAEYMEEKSVGGNKMAVAFAAVNGYVGEYDTAEKILTIDKAGLETDITVKMDGKVVGPWLLDFTSSKESVAIVSDTGRISTKQKGKAVITAALKKDSSKKISFTVNVKENVLISDLTVRIRKPDYGTVKTEVIDGKTYKVVEYLKTSLAKGSKRFSVSVDAKEEGGDENLMVEMAWKSVDSSVAFPVYASSIDNMNTIQVRKGVEGETMITVKVTNKDAAKTVCQENIIVRVIDATPRLADEKVSVNSLSSIGTAIDIVPVYGYDIINDGEELQICKMKVSKGVITYPVMTGFEVVKANGKHYIIATEDLKIKSGETLTYKGDSQLFIKGEFELTGDEFIIPIPELTVTKKAVNPTVKLTGKINLFYNTKASESEIGKVKVTQNLKTETVTRYELVSEKNYKKAGSEEVDSFAANFEISAPNASGTAYITRTDSAMVKVDGKNVTTGYLYIYYDGYNTPIKKKITVPTENVKPNYVLSKKSATASKYRNEQEYRVKLLDAKTKTVIDLTENDTLSFNDLQTTEDLFDRTVLDSEIEDDIILLKVKEAPRKGKVVVIVRKESWTKSVQYTFELAVTTKHPKAKFTPASVTLNTLCPDEAATLTGSVTSQDAFLTGFDETTLRFAGTKSQKKEAQKLLNMMEVDGTNITASLPEGGVKKGTYQFKIMPTIEYYGSGREFTISEVAFKVVVKNDTPKMTLKKTTFNMNTKYAGIEEVSAGFSIANLPAGSAYTLNTDGLTLTPLKATNSNAQFMKNKIALDFDQTSGKVCVVLAEDTLDNFEFEYYVSGLSVTIGEKTVPLGRFKIKVVGKKLSPKMTVKAAGSINTVNPGSKITYTMTVGNVNSAIADVKIWEYKSNGSYYYDEEGTAEENRTSEHFEGVLEGNKFIVRAKEGATLKAGTTYKIRLAYALEVSEDEYASSAILSVKPGQTMPKIKTSKSTAYLYAGQNRPKDVVVKITPTTVKTAEIIDVKFAKGTTTAMKKAFKVSYDETTQQMTLTLVNPAMLTLEKEYEMKFEIVCANQMTNSEGTVFKLKMTVRK
ncbi:MAG: leucine-rich repeat protein [Lachnospiraceae bacterium]|nr:leucine-rich repeat protein [Lachnospiraceae bacterium]